MILDYSYDSDNNPESESEKNQPTTKWWVQEHLLPPSACESVTGYQAMSFLEPGFGTISSPYDALAVAKTIPPGPIGGERHMALTPEALISGQVSSIAGRLTAMLSETVLPTDTLAVAKTIPPSATWH